MRYRGQAYNLTVPFAGRPVTAETIAAAEAAFEDEHHRLYNYTPEVTETEIVTLRVRALATDPRHRLAILRAASEQSDGATARRVWADGWREWTVNDA